MAPLKTLMERTDRVHILGPGTDLTFSIKGMPAVPCAGRVNIPDGEIFTAPVRESVNGTIAYNVPSTHDGFSFENMRLTFRDGRITSVACAAAAQRSIGGAAQQAAPYRVDLRRAGIIADGKVSAHHSASFSAGCAVAAGSTGAGAPSSAAIAVLSAFASSG